MRLTHYNIQWYFLIATPYKGFQSLDVFRCLLDQPQLIWNRMTRPTNQNTGFSCPPRRVTLKASSFSPWHLLNLLGFEMQVMPLPKSSNVLSAGRDPHIQSALKLIPSGVSGKRFFRTMFVPGGTGQGRKVTRHPFVISPRRQCKGMYALPFPLRSCFLPGTGRSFELTGFDQPTRQRSLASSGGASQY